MNEKDDIPRIEAGEKIKVDIDLENVVVKKKKRYPFFVFLLFILLVLFTVIVFEFLDKQDAEYTDALLESQTDDNEVWQGAFDSRDTFEACRNSFVSVIAEGKRCSGFVYSEDGWIATVEGVVNENVVGRIEVVLCDGRRFLVESFRQNRESGITLLKIDATELCAARLNIGHELCVGEEIFSFCAFSENSGASLFSGKVAHTDSAVDVLRANGGVRKLLLVQVGILLTEEGVGAPIFNSRGELVGIACASGEGGGERYMVDYVFELCDINRLLSAMKDGKRAGDIELFSIIVD